MQTTDQQISSEILTEFFVYWVNGVGPEKPYFAVIVRQTGPAAIGSGPPPFDGPSSRGWFQASFQVGPCGFTDAQGQPLTDGFSLSGHTPKSENDNDLYLDLSVSMALHGKTAGGQGTNAFSAGLNSHQSFDGWRIADRTAGDAPQWVFVEAQGWDPLQLPLGSDSLLTQLYDDDGSVIALPPQSFDSLSFDALSAWQFVPPASPEHFTAPNFLPPPSFRVTFTSAASQLVALVHNPSGCTGALGRGQVRHVFSSTHAQSCPPGYTVDLGTIAGLGNYPHQQT
jgi:hypothetical protein